MIFCKAGICMYDFTANIKSAIAEMIKAVLSALCIITSLFQCDISHPKTPILGAGRGAAGSTK
jgi:hypothetical protein